MKIKTLTFMVVVFLSSCTLIATKITAQPVFEKKYSTTTPDQVALFATAGQQGSIIVCGSTYYSPYEGIVMNIDNSGSLIWAKKIAGSFDNVLRRIRPTSDGGYIATGYVNFFGGGGKDLLLMKFDGSGNVSWSKTYATNKDDTGWDVKQTTDGGYIVTGESGKSTSVNDGSIYLLKTDNSGTETWSVHWGAGMGNTGQHVFQTADGGYLVGIEVNNGFQGLIKTNSTGGIQWSRNNRGTTLQYVGANDIKVLSDGSIVMVGSGDDFSNNESVTVAKLNSTGHVQWWRIFGGNTYSDRGLGVEEGYGGSLLVTAYSNCFGPSYQNLLLLNIDKTTGALLGARTSSIIEYQGMALSRTSDNGFVGAGTSDNGIYVAKMDGLGGTGCSQPTASPISESTLAYFDTTLNWTPTGTVTMSGSQTFVSTDLSLSVTTLCSGTGMPGDGEHGRPTIFPNPAGDFLVVEIPGQPALVPERIEVVSASGSVSGIEDYSISGSRLVVNTSSLPAGMYLVRVICGTETFSGKFIVR